MNIFIAKSLYGELSSPEKKYLSKNLKGHRILIEGSNKNLNNKILRSCEVIFGNLNPELLNEAPSLRWIQLESAGFAEYQDCIQFNKFLKISNLKDFFSDQVAHTAVASILSFYRKIPTLSLLQEKKKWVGDPLRKQLETLTGKNILFIGSGYINKRIKKLLAGFDCVFEFTNSQTPKGKLKKLIKQSEIVICCTPGTPKTNNLLNKDLLNQLSKNCLLVNIGRGNAIDEKQLIHILQKKKILGAILDVTNQEPIPQNHPLWTLKNVLLTQHTAGGSQDELLKKIDFFKNNLDRYLKNKKPLNLVNFKRGY